MQNHLSGVELAVGLTDYYRLNEEMTLAEVEMIYYDLTSISGLLTDPGHSNVHSNWKPCERKFNRSGSKLNEGCG